MPAHLAETALAVGALAALASLINALVNIRTWWLENRGLEIGIRADPWGEFEDLRRQAGFVLEISNRARTPNWIREITCRLDAKSQPIVLEPPGFTDREIKPFSFSRAAITLPKSGLPEGPWQIEFAVVPVRGHRRKFRFPKKAVLPEF